MGTWGSWNKSKATETKQPTKKKRDTYGKGRSSRTNQNKLNKLTLFYNGLFKRSQKLKKSKKFPKKTKYFCDRYPTLKDFLKYHPLKKVSEKR